MMKDENGKTALQQGYFLLEKVRESPNTEYRMIDYFQTEEALRNYIELDFSGTAAEEITRCSLEELSKGKACKIEATQGCGTHDIIITLVHDTNIDVLFRYLDSVTAEDFYGNQRSLSEFLREAESSDEIENIICCFNEAEGNYW